MTATDPIEQAKNRVLPDLPQTAPADEHNRKLVANVHPTDWQNPEPAGKYHLVVVGAGTAGLVTAAGAAGLGAKVALVERHLMGGDCLNVGCVPSKALIAAARAAADVRRAGEFGVQVRGDVEVDFPRVMERMRSLRAGISPHDSAQRFTDLGIDVFLGEGRFTSRNTLQVGDKTLTFGKACIATGARATLLPIPGLEDANPLTNETLFSLTELPPRLAVIGAGPIGCEMAQTFARFGSKVTLIEVGEHVLAREDFDAAQRIQAALVEDGVELLCGATTEKIERRGSEIELTVKAGGGTRTITADRILLGVGRAPNVEGLGLEDIGVAFDRTGVKVDEKLRTTVKNIYAAGDVCFPYKFTHTADAMARIVIGNALFFGRGKTSKLVIPWCTYTDPEIAHVGIYPREAEAKGIEIDTYTVEMSQVDRAILEGDTEGFLKVHTARGKDRILGATMVGRHAGDMISEISLAITAGVGLGAIAKTIHPYPTQAEAIKKAADAYNRTRLTPFAKKVLGLLLKLG